jgi:hypothetical protein
MRVEVLLTCDDDVDLGENTVEHCFDGLVDFHWDSSDDYPRWDWWFDEVSLVPHNKAGAEFLERHPDIQEKLENHAVELARCKISEEGIRGNKRNWF